MDYSRDIDKLRHTCAHVMAQAVQELWPGTKVAIGPAIEQGFYYDFDKEEPFVDQDLKKIEKQMWKIINKDLPLTQSTMNRDEALQFFKERGEDYKVDLIENFDDQEVSIFTTGDGDFVDLCKGPHVPSTGAIKGMKLQSIAGAYWRGNENNRMLQRIYGTAFFSKEELAQHLKMLEEAEKRDHRKIGKQLDLFHIYQEEAGAGLVFYHPKGAMMRKILEDYCRDENLKRGYELVMTPNFLKGKLWDISGHSEHYRENMYYLENIDNEEYAVKPMNCPGHMMVFKSKIRSYRDLPIKFFELGTVYRQEKAGVLHGLLRVRGFTQDDAHIFCRPNQVTEEVVNVIDFIFDVMRDFQFKDIDIELSTRPEKATIGTDEEWELATTALREALEQKGIDYKLNEGDGAFYGPKIDFKLRDAIGRSWQCSTVQCDFSLPERFDLSYADEDGLQKRPIMLHRAIFGSLERFFGTLIEHFAGNFPVWLAPVQAVVIPIKDMHDAFAKDVADQMRQHGLRVEIDARNESLGKRIREASVQKVPYVMVVGDKEVDAKEVSLRKHQKGDIGHFSIPAIVDRLTKEIVDKSS